MQLDSLIKQLNTLLSDDNFFKLKLVFLNNYYKFSLPKEV